MREPIPFSVDIPDAIPASLFYTLDKFGATLNAYNRGELDHEFVLPSSSLVRLEAIGNLRATHPTEPCPPPVLEIEGDGMPDRLELREPPLERGFVSSLEVGSEVDFNGVNYTIYSCSLGGLTVYVKTSTL